MSENQFSFQFQNLVVDYISFKFQDLDYFAQKELTDYLFKLGFNSYQESGKLAKPIKEPIQIDLNNQFEALFVKEAPYWTGTTLHFSGINADRFYFFSKEQIIDWTLFSSGILNRVDLYYVRTHKTDDKISVREFFQNCHKQLTHTNKNVSFDKNSKGLILTIGNRKSNHFFRIYQSKKKNSLKFEFEMKGRFLRKYHTFLISNHLEEFEQKLSSHFLISFGKLLSLKYSYLDWLIIKLRPLQKHLIYKDNFSSDYIASEIKTSPTKLITLLQFLNYAQSLDYEIKYLEDVSYRILTFKLQDFLKMQNKSASSYQFQKTKNFFNELQTDILITSFSSIYYRSLVAVPLVRFDKIKKYWVVKVWLLEELFYYQYPFFLPNLFNKKLTKDEFHVRVKIVQTFASENIEKVFLIQDFLSAYPSIISNQRRNNIKKEFIQLVKELEDNNLIESNYKIFINDSIMSVDELTISNISEGFILYEKISL